MEDLEIRRMNEADVPRVMEIAAEVNHAPRYSRSTWLGILSCGTAPARVALVAGGPGGDLSGFAVASLLAPEAELEAIAVAARSQRQGIGRRLLRGLLAELRPAGAREIWLEVRVSNESAIGLYRSLGFCESGRRARYYADPVEDALLMSLPLRLLR